MHLLEDLRLLAADFETHLHAEFGHFSANLLKGLLALRAVDNHHHVKVILHDRLRDVEDIDVRFSKIRGSLGDNADSVLTDDGDDDFIHGIAYYTTISPKWPYPHDPAILGQRNVRIAAKRADGTVMNRRAAIRTFLLQNLSTNGTVLAANGILLQTVRLQERSPINFIREMRRTLRVRTKAPRGLLGLRIRKRQDLWTNRLGRFTLLRKLYAKLLAQLFDDFIVQLRSITLLEHGKGGLLTTHFGCKHALRKPRFTTGFLYLSADLWTQICHGTYYASEQSFRQEGSYQHLSTELSTHEHFLVFIMFISS